MRIYELTLGGKDATIFQPDPGYDDLSVFRTVFPSEQIYGLDVESTALTDMKHWDPDFRVRLVQFATEGYAWVLNPEDRGHRRLIDDLANDPTVGFCSHSNMDVLSLNFLDLDIADRNIDTLMLAKMAAPDDRLGGKDLKNLVKQYFGPEMENGEKSLHARFQELWENANKGRGAKSSVEQYGWNTVDIYDPTYVRYAGLDAVACRRLLEPLMHDTQAPRELLELEIWLAAQATRVQIRGMRVDAGAAEQLLQTAEQGIKAPEARILDRTGIVPRSVKLVEWVGKQGVDLSALPLTDTGKPSLAKRGPEILLAQDGLPSDVKSVLEDLLEFRGHIDRLNKASGVVKATADGRVHPVLNTIGAVTGRMSSSGPNFQNFSKSDPALRGLFIPEDGCGFLTADFDQIELRVLAALADETKMIDVIKSGGDLHQLTADEIGIDRQLAKMVNFLIVYGGGGGALSEQAGIELQQAKEIVAAFRDRYRAVNYLTHELGKLTDCVRTISGRRIPVPLDKMGRPRSYANVNYVVQGSARDILVDAWRRFADKYGRAAYVWYPIHDELVLQCPVEELATVSAEIEACMSFDFMGVPITASAVPLRDSDGSFRWMTSSLAEKVSGENAR